MVICVRIGKVIHMKQNEILFQLRKQFGKTQQDLATHLGITKATYSRYETGHREPGLDVLNRIALFYGVDPGIFFRKTTKGYKFESSADYEASSLDELFEQMMDTCLDNYEFAVGKDNFDDDEFIYRLIKSNYNIRKDDLPNMSFEDYLNFLKVCCLEKDK